MGLSDMDIKEIKETYTKMMDCTMAFDWDGYASTFADDAVIFPPEGELFQVKGQKSLSEWTSGLMTGVDGLDISYDINGVDGDGRCAYLYSISKEKVKLADNDETLDLGEAKLLVVLEKQSGDSWKIKLQIWNK